MKTGKPDVVKAQLESKKSSTVHPLVRTHPDTGTKAVWFHKGKTETVAGMSPEETQDFLQDLTDKIGPVPTPDASEQGPWRER
jgi:taurine dioxygenase